MSFVQWSLWTEGKLTFNFSFLSILVSFTQRILGTLRVPHSATPALVIVLRLGWIGSLESVCLPYIREHVGPKLLKWEAMIGAGVAPPRHIPRVFFFFVLL